MSIKALNWAIEASRGKDLSANAKLVLWQIADAHNIEHGAFVKQQTIAEGVEIHRATVNRCLDDLVAAQLISREQRIDKSTGQQLSTRYHLAFEKTFSPQDVVSHVAESDTDTPGPTGDKACGPAVENSEARVANDPGAVSHPDATLTFLEPISPLPPSTEPTFPSLCEKWDDDKLGDLARAAATYDRLSPAQQAAALEHVDLVRTTYYSLRRPLPVIRTYLIERAWEEVLGANIVPAKGSDPAFFKIETGTKEWSAWLAYYRKTNAAYYAGMKLRSFMLMSQRWPPGATPAPQPIAEEHA